MPPPFMIKNATMIKPDDKNAHSKRINRTLSVAPMMDWTDRNCRFFHRLLAPNALLYTEMVTTGALIHGDVKRHLDFSAEEHPVALQLGGSDAADLSTAARMAEEWGYDEINLNCGCPSDRVQKGSFGACLMREPELVAECVSAMRAVTSLPVTVKSRIGIDESEDYKFLEDFIVPIMNAGCDTFIIHARKAWLKGLSPKENREIPPLRYDIVKQLKDNFPHLHISLNGGVKTVDQVQSALQSFDGVMIGREAYENPYRLAEYEHALFGTPLPTRADIARQMIPYLARRRAESPDMPVNAVTRHMLGLFHGEPRARIWRRTLTLGAHQDGASEALIDEALSAVL